MKFTKKIALLTLLAIGFSFQLFLPIEKSLVVQQVEAAGLVGTEWYCASDDLTLNFEKDGEVIFFYDGTENWVVGNYTENGSSVNMKFPQDSKATGKINGKTMKVKFYLGDKILEPEFTKIR